MDQAEVASPERDQAVPLVVQEPISPVEQQKLNQMREALDLERHSEAMRVGRVLMRASADIRVKLQLIDYFGWIGRLAVPELVALIDDQDDRVAHAAFSAWEMAVSQYQSESGRIEAVISSVRKVHDATFAEMMLMQLDACDQARVIKAVDGLIVSSKGLVCQACAKQYFEQLTGEIWSSPERTKSVLEKKKGGI